MADINLIERYIQSNAFGRLIGMEFKILKPGEIEYHLRVKADHLATPQSAHGGLISALVDGALGTAGLSAVYTENKVVSTIEYKINFLSPVYLGDVIIASARVESLGKRILVISCDVRCTNRENTMVAKALGTLMRIRQRRPVINS